MLDALVHRQDRQIAGVGQAPRTAVEPLQIAQHLRLAVGQPPRPIGMIGAGKDELLFPDAFADIGQKAVRILAEEADDPIESAAADAFGEGRHGRHSTAVA